MKNKKGSLFINIGLLLIICAIALTGYNIYSSDKAAENSSAALSQLNRILPDDTKDILKTPDYILNPDMKMPVKTVDGWDYIGVVDIPALGLNLPVIDSYSRQAIKVAPACYGGTAYKDDFIICAHNYKVHFGKISSLKPGDAIAFVDTDGNVFNYEVTEKETLAPSEVDRLNDGDWDLTLISCTVSGQARMTVRCKKLKLIND